MFRDSGHIREPAVAGSFYPRHADVLRAAIEEAFLSPLGPGTLPEPHPAGPRRLFGIIAPHAGYPYSAQCAAWAYAEVAHDGRPETVVLLGVNHRGIGAPMALSPADGWRTPLGCLPVATAAGQRLRTVYPDISPDAGAHAQEHSLEVQVPFLQYLFGEVSILPVLIGHAPVTAVCAMGRALAVLSTEFDVLIVASTDFSHYVSHADAERLDRQALDAVAAVQPETLVSVVQRQDISMCGVLPVTALLAAGQERGIASATVLHYHTSGDVTGDRHAVVGYGAAALYR